MYPGLLPSTLPWESLAVGSWESPGGRCGFGAMPRCPSRRDLAKVTPTPRDCDSRAAQPGTPAQEQHQSHVPRIGMDLGASGKGQEGCAWERGR